MTMQPPDKTDEELVKMYQTSLDKNIVGVLFKRHSLMCYGVSNKYLKDEDAAQDATMQIFEKLFSDLTKHEILNFRSWLHSVCRNYCLMELRKPMRVMRMRESEDDHENEFMELEQFLHQEENPEDKFMLLDLCSRMLSGAVVSTELRTRFNEEEQQYFLIANSILHHLKIDAGNQLKKRMKE